MSAILAHRGPDDSRTVVDGSVGLAHARLSIVDPARGWQPMTSDDGSVSITFSGEIFNYLELRQQMERKGQRFRTESDTEVLLRLYLERDADCVQQLNGQWAFAIWDRRKRKLFLSRDRLGIRPLFYTIATKRFIFASEVKAIFACPSVPREINLHALDQIFTFWVTIPPQTIFRGIFQVPPGHSLTVQNETVSVRPYWNLEFPPREDIRTQEREVKAQELLHLMSDAVRLQMRADVPIGTYLSGGIDSTFVSAIAARYASQQLRTFSVSFASSAFDESRYQRVASTFLATAHNSITCHATDIGQIFPKVMWHVEQPILRTAPAPLYLLAQYVRESGLKVVLTGEGADEAFGGYDIFKEAKVRAFCRRHPDSQLRPRLLRRLYPYLSALHDQGGGALKSFFARPDNGAEPFFSHAPRWKLTETNKLFFSRTVRADLADYDAYEELRSYITPSYWQWDPLCQAQYLETVLLLPGYILSSQGDRVAMAHAVETRHPFLDHRVVEFAAHLHPRLKLRVLNEKYLLKKAASGLVPLAVLERTKQPYRSPDGESFVNTQALRYLDALCDPWQLERDGLFHSGAVSALVSKFKAQRAHGVRDNMALTGIVSTQLLVGQFVANQCGYYAA